MLKTLSKNTVKQLNKQKMESNIIYAPALLYTTEPSHSLKIHM